ncbi:MAG: tRNA (N6-isopentenyl adenosine(37)-C2)-methylthiotransferase MiaB [Phascolarctobacterium sp.]|nr:tRNA (N6-isopentenyl adenosine(37)-C2)-methylthiotransferase MiaB [Candidatus Phascolarctobacterium caballi]
MKKYYSIINYGCQMNESDAEHYAGQLKELGYVQAEDFHHADVIVVNTCCVRESAEKRIAGKIGELKAVKTANPNVIICIAGCMAQKDGERLLKKYPQIDILLGTSYVNDFKRILVEYDKTRSIYCELRTGNSMEFEGQKVRLSPFHAWIPIMYGCNNFCTYCIVPYVRGRERSRTQEQILAEIRQAVTQGYKEFTLLGQNVNSYGKDFDDKNAFAKLLRAADAIDGVERLHYMTSHPRDMNEDVILAVAEGRHISHHFHVPVQSGSTEILRRMNRGYTREKYLDLIRTIRKHVPDAVITTDIIVGFPGETEADFIDTLSLVETVGFDAAFTFIYSKRSGTPAAKMDNQVPLEVKKDRLNRLMETENKYSLQKNKMLIGKVVEVFAEGATKNKNVWSGRTRENKLVLWDVEDKVYRVGDAVQVKIDTAQTWLVKGKTVECHN